MRILPHAPIAAHIPHRAHYLEPAAATLSTILCHAPGVANLRKSSRIEVTDPKRKNAVNLFHPGWGTGTIIRMERYQLEALRRLRDHHALDPNHARRLLIREAEGAFFACFPNRQTPTC